MNEGRLQSVAELLAAGLLDAFRSSGRSSVSIEEAVEMILETPIERPVIDDGVRLLERLVADHRSPATIPEEQ